MPPATLAAGSAVGDYDLLDVLGEGGSGTVFRGRHRPTGDLVAVKILPPGTARNEVLLKRFEQEFRSASRLDHPNIVRALDFSRESPTPYLVMELVDGVSLGEKVERDGPFDEAEAIRILVAICQGIAYAHSHGLIHRDIKPDNVLLTTTGEVKVTDLGLAKELLDDQDLTRTGRGLGTPHYMAPEQFRNAKSADVRSDVYALGATLFTLVTGGLPFGKSSPLEAWMKKKETKVIPPRSLAPRLSAQTERVILTAMEGEPRRRYATCAALVEALKAGTAAALDVTTTMPAVDTSENPPPPPAPVPENTWVQSALILVTALAAVVVGLALFGG